MLKLFMTMVISAIKMIVYLGGAVIYGLAACVVAVAKRRRAT